MKIGLPMACLLGGLIAWYSVMEVLEDRSSITGSDERAMNLVRHLEPSYVPWVSPAYQPAALTETILFGLQALLGGTLLFYSISRLRVRINQDSSIDFNTRK